MFSEPVVHLVNLTSRGRVFSYQCNQDWSASPLEVFDVVGLDRVDLNLLGHSYRSKTGESTDFIIMDSHLHYWLPRLDAEDGWQLD